MNEKQFDLMNRLMAEHHAEYVAFTRLLLTTSAGTLALLAGLAQRQTESQPLAETAFRLGWCCLCLSLLFGLALQWLLVMQPLRDAGRASAAMRDESRTTAVIHRPPEKRQTAYLACQFGFFAAAFVALTASLLWR